MPKWRTRSASGASAPTTASSGGPVESSTSSIGTKTDAAIALSGLVVYTFAFENLASSTQGKRIVGATSTTIAAQMPYSGSVVGLSYLSNAAKTAGTVSFTVYVGAAGVTPAATTAATTWTTNNTGDIATWNPGTYTFGAGGSIYPYATVTGFTPTTADVEVMIYVSFQS